MKMHRVKSELLIEIIGAHIKLILSTHECSRKLYGPLSVKDKRRSIIMCIGFSLLNLQQLCFTNNTNCLVEYCLHN